MFSEKEAEPTERKMTFVCVSVGLCLYLWLIRVDVQQSADYTFHKKRTLCMCLCLFLLVFKKSLALEVPGSCERSKLIIHSSAGMDVPDQQLCYTSSFTLVVTHLLPPTN